MPGPINYKEVVPEHVRSLAAYVPGAPATSAQRDASVTWVKLASNENPFGPSPLAITAIRQSIEHCALYPDTDATELRLELARRHRVMSEQILVTAGSTEMLGVICRTLLRPGLNAVSSERSFIMYPIVTAAAGGQFITAPMRNDALDLDAIAAAVNSSTRVILLANPNNPTGTAFDASAFTSFMRKIPHTITIVIDEAYYEFAYSFASMRGVEYSRSLDQLKAGRNIVILRSFSKIFGLAGARVGYGIGPPELMRYFSRMRTTFSVSSIAQSAALAALRDDDHMRKTLANNVEGAKQLTDELLKIDQRVSPTWANFLYCELGKDAARTAACLRSNGVSVRPLTVWGAPTAVRVTIGTPEQNNEFLKALKKVMAAEG